MPLLAVLFDLDDTLHDKSVTLNLVAKMQFREFNLISRGVEMQPWIEHFVALNNERIEKTEVFSQLATTFTLSGALEDALLADFDTNLGKLAYPYAGAVEALAALKTKGLKLGIVTNGRDGFQRSKIEGMGMTLLFDSIVTSGGFGAKKPDPRIFLACLADLQVSPASAAFVGDDFEADMEPSIALGMHSIWKTAKQSNLVTFCSNEISKIGQYLLSAA